MVAPSRSMIIALALTASGCFLDRGGRLGNPSEDGGTLDAATPAMDSGPPTEDAGEAMDSGTVVPEEDAGSPPPPDSGPTDAGRPPPDAFRPADSAVQRDAGGPTQSCNDQYGGSGTLTQICDQGTHCEFYVLNGLPNRSCDYVCGAGGGGCEGAFAAQNTTTMRCTRGTSRSCGDSFSDGICVCTRR